MRHSASTVYLVSCVSKKLPRRARARDLYVSTWFEKARAYVERTGSPWFILSAKYGLVSPDQVLSPYERTLNAMSMAQRRAWAQRVRAQMEKSLPPTEQIVILAGSRYREFLIDYLRHRARTVRIPMRGRGIGRQLQYLTKALANGRRVRVAP
jgi:hypothetical protein